MKRETELALDKVRDLMTAARNTLDSHMYWSDYSATIPQKDKTYCRKVYDVVCKVLDML